MKRLFIVLFMALAVLSCDKEKADETTCLVNEKIPEEKLKPIMQKSRQLMHLLETGKTKELYNKGTAEMQSRQTFDQFKHYLENFTESFGEMSFPRLREVYYLTSNSDKKQVWVPCNIGEKGVNDLHLVPTNRKLAVGVFRVRSEMEELRVIIRMEDMDGQWKFSAVEIYPVTIDHKLYGHYFQKAREYRERGLLRLAVLYYKTAIKLSEMGIGVQEFVSQAIVKQLQQIKVDYIPSGEQKVWKVDGEEFKVYSVDPVYAQGNHLVQIRYISPSLGDKKELEKNARKLAEFANRKFPEYRLGFDGIRIMATSQKKSEAMMTWHKMFLFDTLPEPDNVPEAESD